MAHIENNITFNELGNTTTGVTTIGDKIIHQNFKSNTDNNQKPTPIINAIEIDWNNSKLPHINNVNSGQYSNAYNYASQIKSVADLLSIIDENQRQIDKIKRELGIN